MKIHPGLDPKHPDDYQATLDMWAKAELESRKEIPYLKRCSEQEAENIHKMLELLNSGGYDLSLMNEYDGKNYVISLENSKTGVEARFLFSIALPLDGIPNASKIDEVLKERNEFAITRLTEIKDLKI